MVHPGPVRVGLVGLGRAGMGMHCGELHARPDQFRLVAACDPIAERRQQMQEKFNCRTYSAVEELIADPDVELVDITSRSCDHFDHAKQALQAGKDVFLEKPMCLDYAHAAALKEIADASPGQLFVRHNRRFEPGFQHIREIIASGILGEVYEIKLRRLGYQRRDDWQTIKAFGGGQLLNWGPHIIDHALQFLESPVRSQWSDLKRVAAVGDAEDHLKIILSGDTGRIVDLEISGGAAIPEPEYIVAGDRGGLICTGNSIHLRYLDPETALAPRVADPGTPGAGSFGSSETLHWIEKTIPVAPAQKSGLDTIWDHLYDAMRRGIPFPVTVDQAVEVMRVISKAKEGTVFEG